jgi:hypothetical protein
LVFTVGVVFVLLKFNISFITLKLWG